MVIELLPKKPQGCSFHAIRIDVFLFLYVEKHALLGSDHFVLLSSTEDDEQAYCSSIFAQTTSKQIMCSHNVNAVLSGIITTCTERSNWY